MKIANIALGVIIYLAGSGGQDDSVTHMQAVSAIALALAIYAFLSAIERFEAKRRSAKLNTQEG